MITRILQHTAIYKLLGITIALGALFGVLFLRYRQPTFLNQQSVITVGSKDIPITIADTASLREQGLSGTTSLARGTGKFFIFDKVDTYGFWMKDMQYPIDIVWIDANKEVVGVVEHALPESYPKIFYPTSPVQYVLEINAGESSLLGLIPGTKINFTQYR
jgi:uncharacterized membrane protein (UPF0127 family)